MDQETQQRIVVTGVNGFVGKHLVNELRAEGIKVIGVSREDTVHPDISDLLEEYIPVDLAETWPEIVDVDAVIHLAGLAAVGPSFESPQPYINLNSAMVTNMAEFYLDKPKKPRFIIVSSGAIYEPDQAMPLKETSVIGFNSPYAVSKVLVENQCEYYRSRGLDCVIVRPFNHVGPGQLEGFLVPDVIAQLKTGNKITVGTITTKRDYTDVRDIARAYRLLATTENLYHSVYNACSGVSTSGEEIIELIKQDMNKQDAEIVVDKSKIRPNDPADIYGDASALLADSGWEPDIPLAQTLADCVDET